MFVNIVITLIALRAEIKVASLAVIESLLRVTLSAVGVSRETTLEVLCITEPRGIAVEVLFFLEMVEHVLLQRILVNESLY